MPIAGAGLVAFNPSANLRFDAFLAKNFLSPATSFAALQTSYSFQGQAVSPVALPAGSRFYIPAHHRFGEETLSANPYVDSWMRSADKFIRNGELERAVAMANCPWEFASTGIDPLLAQYGWAVSTALFNSILPEGARMIGGRGVFRIWVCIVTVILPEDSGTEESRYFLSFCSLFFSLNFIFWNIPFHDMPRDIWLLRLHQRA